VSANPITPTVGRVVLYRTDTTDGSETYPGIVNRVHSETCIDICVMWPGHGAIPTTVVSVEYTESVEDHDAAEYGPRWGWMTYQKDVAAGKAAPTLHASAASENSKGGGFSFSAALVVLKDGGRVARSGWNGNGMFAYLVPAASYPVQTGAAKAHFGEGSLVPYRAYLALKTAQEDVATWVPSVSDVLAEDWYALD
jgi:Protein of unknown function (DUF2829)